MFLVCFGGHSVALTRVKSASPNNPFISKAPCPSDVSQIRLADRWLSKHIGRNSRYGAWAAPEWFVIRSHVDVFRTIHMFRFFYQPLHMVSKSFFMSFPTFLCNSRGGKFHLVIPVFAVPPLIPLPQRLCKFRTSDHHAPVH